jgi:hypothetical protein
VFERIDRARLADNLLERVHDPNGIAQGRSSLCGPAALVRAVAFADPVEYVRYVTRLYDTGTAEIRCLRVEAGDKLRAYDPDGLVPPADWIALAALRDSENRFSATTRRSAGSPASRSRPTWRHGSRRSASATS